MEELGLPVTVLRPTAFKELMTDKAFYPSGDLEHGRRSWARTGRYRGCAWPTAAAVYADPAKFVGKDLNIASDVRTIAECRSIYREVMGRKPSSFPMPQ